MQKDDFYTLSSQALSSTILSSDTLVEEEVKEKQADTDNSSRIIVYNDDVNTFDWVIDSFVKVCNHSAQQAEQLSYMIHFKGKAIVKTGPRKELKPMKEALIERGLSAVLR